MRESDRSGLRFGAVKIARSGLRLSLLLQKKTPEFRSNVWIMHMFPALSSVARVWCPPIAATTTSEGPCVEHVQL